MCTYPVQPCLHILLAVCTFFLLFAHSSCTSLFKLLFIKCTVYCIAHFISLHILPLIFFLFLFYSYLYLYIFSCVVSFLQRTLLNLLRLLLLGTEHRWCEDPIESAPFIIRDRAPMVRGPYCICSVYY